MRPAISAGSGSCPNRETGHRTARRVGYSKVKFAPDSPQERAGFEPSVPRSAPSQIFQVRLFRLSGAEVRRRNAGCIVGFEEEEFEADGATKEVSTQICPSRPDAVQLRAQKVNEPAKIRIVVQRDPLGVNEVVRYG